MSENESLQKRITTYWTNNELEEVLHPTNNVIDSDEKIQRDKLRSAIKEQTSETDELLTILSTVVGWDNKDRAIAIWSGNLDIANDLRTDAKKLDSPRSAEAALIERFAQPVYQEKDFTKSQLVEILLPVIRSSPISQLRPDIWKDDDLAREQVSWVLDEHVEKLDWYK